VNNILSAWFVVNVLAPVLLPVAGIFPLTLVPVGAPVRLMAIVKDGQLCWAAVAMGASSLYETFAAVAANKPVDGSGGCLLIICFVMLQAMVLAAAGSVFSTPLPVRRPKTFWAWCNYYRAFLGSCVLWVIMAGDYTVLHSIVA
jgi:hypothetical protein